MHYCTIIITIHLHYSTILMLTPPTNSSRMALVESVIFQPVLQAYPTQHSWIITAHILLGNLEHHWKTFNRQFDRTQQLLHSLEQYPSAPTPATVNTSTGTIQHQGHIQFWQNNHNFCHKTTAIQPTMHTHLLQIELTTLPWRCCQLAYWDSHHKRHTQH